MTYYIDIIDNRNKILFELLKQEHKHVEVFDLTANKFSENDVVVFAPSKKIDEEYVGFLPENITLIGGNYSELIRELLCRKNIKYINLMQDETFAIKNANLTCEGVLALIITHSQKSIYENSILILGAGRIAKAMSILLNKIGANYSIASFNKDSFPQNYIYSKNNYFAYDFVRDLHKFDVIINTIPAEILDENALNHIAKDAVFIETASTKCLDESKVNGRFNYILAPALPQKYTCQTAGKLMLDAVLERNI